MFCCVLHYVLTCFFMTGDTNCVGVLILGIEDGGRDSMDISWQVKYEKESEMK